MLRLTVLSALLLSLLLAPAAHAGEILDRAAQALANDPVYVDPDAERGISDSDAADLRQQISSRHAGPMYIAVLPNAAKNEAGGSADGVAQALRDALGRQGTYAVVAGNSFAGGSTVVSGAGQAADEALDAHGGQGVQAVLLDYVDRVGDLRSGDDAGSGDGGGGGGGTGALILLGLAGAGGAALLVSRRKRRREEDAEFAEVKENARDDLV